MTDPSPCDCTQDGHCPRYDRHMSGRFRELCAGINCDPGTAAAFRAQWAHERDVIERAKKMADTGELKIRVTIPEPQPPIPLLLKQDQAPGDAVAMTAAIYSLHRAHPGRYLTAVESYWPDVWLHNPDITAHVLPCGELPDHVFNGRIGKIIQMHYPAVAESNSRSIHFTQAWCEHLSSALGVHVPLLTNRPRLYLGQEELSAPRKVTHDDYWLICSGGKHDFTTKLWGHDRYQKVVDLLRGRVKFIQVGGSQPVVPWREEVRSQQADDHPPLRGTAIYMVGATSLRDLFLLTRRARGVLCCTSLLMHVAAALERPAVVIAGGREPVSWNAYPVQQYVHTVGALQCWDSTGRANAACWRIRTVPLGDSEACDANPCLRPVSAPDARTPLHVIPQCMEMITPHQVAELILQYDRQYNVT